MSASNRMSWATVVAAAVFAAPIAAFAQSYPSKPVRIIAGAPASILDIIARQIAQRLSERWGQGVVVENHAQVTISSGIAAKALPDGYTLLLADRTSHAVAPHLQKTLLYDPVKDFAPITLVARAPMLLVAHPSLPPNNLREFIAYAKQRPGAIDYSAAGPGTANHITAERFKLAAGIDLTNIQYKGGGAAMAAILSGEAKVGFGLMPVSLPHVKAGKVKAYAITSARRFAGAPEIPTMAEAGLSGFDADELWSGMFAPARTPPALIAKLNADIVEILQTPAMRDALLALGAEPAPSTPVEFAQFIKSETAMMKKVIEAARIRAE